MITQSPAIVISILAVALSMGGAPTHPRSWPLATPSLAGVSFPINS
jgi:hypothetical protein